MKKNKAAVKDELLNKLNNFHDKDSQKYWDIFNMLRDTKASTNNCFISAKQLVTHYNSLYHKTLDIDDDILDKLQEAEIIGKGNNILDYEISDKDLFDVIKTLKCIKSPGPDNIINEMLKCGKNHRVHFIS